MNCQAIKKLLLLTISLLSLSSCVTKSLWAPEGHHVVTSHTEERYIYVKNDDYKVPSSAKSAFMEFGEFTGKSILTPFALILDILLSPFQSLEKRLAVDPEIRRQRKLEKIKKEEAEEKEYWKKVYEEQRIEEGYELWGPH